MKEKNTKHQTIATLLALIPGFGHFYNRQFWQGGAILIIMAAYGFLTAETIFSGVQGGGLAGLFTLGTVPGEDHSLFFLVEGLLALVLVSIGIAIYLFSIFRSEERRVGKEC